MKLRKGTAAAARRAPGKRRGSGAGRPRAARPEFWRLRLYVADGSPKSHVALVNLKRLCETHLAGRYRIEVVDLVQNPRLARGDQIVAIPTLVRRLPQPIRKIVGDLSSEDRTLVGLQLRPAS
jgi:circadian clock protein KaiB